MGRTWKDERMKTRTIAGLAISLFLINILGMAHVNAVPTSFGTEIIYDDDSAEWGAAYLYPHSGIYAVQFTPPFVPALITELRFYIYDVGNSLPLKVHVLDSTFADMITPFTTTVNLGWNDIGLSYYDIVVTGDFLLGLEWTPTTIYDNTWLGLDTSGPDYLRSWIHGLSPPVPWVLRSLYVPNLPGNFLIRAVVAKRVCIDIKPASWPNPLTLKGNGVLPVTICGTEDFDVMTVDPETVRLTLEGVAAGVPPLRWEWEDVATPYTGGDPYGGHDCGADGYLDLTLKFKTQEVIATLGLDAFDEGEVIYLILTGYLKAEYDGAPIQGQDNVWIHC